MNTIRLTYSPYGFGKVLKIVSPYQEGDAEEAPDLTNMQSTEKEQQHKFSEDVDGLVDDGWS